MAQWDIVSEQPAGTDPWKVKAEQPIGANPWKVKQEVPASGVLSQAGVPPWQKAKNVGAAAIAEMGHSAIKSITGSLESSESLRQGGEYDAGPPMGAAMLTAGMKAPAAKLPSAPLPKPAALSTAQKIFSPNSVSPAAEDAASRIRSAQGTAARDTETTRAVMEPFHARVNAMPDAERFGFIDYVEGRSAGKTLADKELQPLADEMRAAYELRKSKLQALPSTATTEFIEDYYPHLWTDPKAAQTFLRGFAKQGSGAALKKRSIPTIADGIAAGLKPATTDPIAATMNYVGNMDRFIATNEVIDTGRAAGTVKYFKPGSKNIPDGWVTLQGRLSNKGTPAGPMVAHAPEDWARVYNNFISRGFHANAEAGQIYDALQSTSNAITSLELGLSGYHAFTMANEAIISDVAKGISQLVGGKPIKALGSIARAPAAPVTRAITGHKVEQVYLGRTPGTPDMRRVVNLLEEAGGRAVGKRHAADYRYSAMGSYWTSFKRGSLKMEARQAMENVKAAPISGGAKELMRLVGRSMETVAQPLFEKYIPKIKNGAFYDTLQAWLEANPGAGHDQQVKMARKIWDSIDNRFGELVQDNIFWNKFMKQSAQLGMRSYSWNLGTVREIAGGALGGLRHPSRLSIKSKDYDPRAAYVIALPIVQAAVNASYQYMKTGNAPESVDDLMAPRTGGTAPGFGGRGEVQERAMTPGYQKDVFGWYHDWKQEALNKVATGPRLAGEAVAGKDWRGDPIANPDDTLPEWVVDYFKWAGSSMGPISIKQMIKGEKTGSNIGRAEQMMGIRPAPGHMQDPEGAQRGMTAIQRRAWQAKQRHDRSQDRQYGGPQE